MSVCQVIIEMTPWLLETVIFILFFAYILDLVLSFFLHLCCDFTSREKSLGLLQLMTEIKYCFKIALKCQYMLTSGLPHIDAVAL